MPKPLQYVPEEAKLWTDSKGRPIAIAEVTIRTIMRMFLLKPTHLAANVAQETLCKLASTCVKGFVLPMLHERYCLI